MYPKSKTKRKGARYEGTIYSEDERAEQLDRDALKDDEDGFLRGYVDGGW